jgi:hypothetical protein
MKRLFALGLIFAGCPALPTVGARLADSAV